MAWICGEEAKYMETLKLPVVADACTMILSKFLADPHIPRPNSCVFTSWYSQPYSGGSYTAIGVGGTQEHHQHYTLVSSQVEAGWSCPERPGRRSVDVEGGAGGRGAAGRAAAGRAGPACGALRWGALPPFLLQHRTRGLPHRPLRRPDRNHSTRTSHKIFIQCEQCP